MVRVAFVIKAEKLCWKLGLAFTSQDGHKRRQFQFEGSVKFERIFGNVLIRLAPSSSASKPSVQPHLLEIMETSSLLLYLRLACRERDLKP